MTSQQPEPCLGGTGTHDQQGRCYSPLACSAFGYCRERNVRHHGPVTEKLRKEWQAEAAQAKAEMAGGRMKLAIRIPTADGPRTLVTQELTLVDAELIRAALTLRQGYEVARLPEGRLVHLRGNLRKAPKRSVNVVPLNRGQSK